MFTEGVPNECLGKEGFSFKHLDPPTDGMKIRESLYFN